MPPAVAAFTDTYLPTVNGVTYSISTLRDRYEGRGGRMDVVFPNSSYEAEDGEFPVKSLPFPFYEGYRLGVPKIPSGVNGSDLVHAHTPFSLGLAGMRYASREDVPFVVSYHTPTSEYAAYVAPDRISGFVASLSSRYESWFLNRADLVLAPSRSTAATIRDRAGNDVEVEVLPNGIDTDHFRPVDPTAFRRRYGLPEDRPLVGYTGRHGYEKQLEDLLDATAELDVTVVFGGDGPARSELEAIAERLDVDARFLGFLEREELPAFYSALDVFAFPSPVETQGIVALEANACGTPVVGVDSGALSETIVDGETGYHFDVGDVEGFEDAIGRAIDEQSSLAETCLDHREAISVDSSLDQLLAAYERVIRS